MNQIRNRTVDQGAAGRCGRFLKKRSCVEGTFFESVHCLPCRSPSDRLQNEDSRLNNGKRSEGSGSPAVDTDWGVKISKVRKSKRGLPTKYLNGQSPMINPGDDRLSHAYPPFHASTGKRGSAESRIPETLRHFSPRTNRRVRKSRTLRYLAQTPTMSAL